MNLQGRTSEDTWLPDAFNGRLEIYPGYLYLVGQA